MSVKTELDALKEMVQSALVRKQEVLQQYRDTEAGADQAYKAMVSAWQERSATQEEMNREYEALKAQSSCYHELWAEYSRIDEENTARIELLRYLAGDETSEMKVCYDRANEAMEQGKRAKASMLFADGRKHKDRRDALYAEVDALLQEIIDAKISTELLASGTDSPAYRNAKDAYEAAKSRHETARAEFIRLKNERHRLKAQLDAAHAEYARLREQLSNESGETDAIN